MKILKVILSGILLIVLVYCIVVVIGEEIARTKTYHLAFSEISQIKHEHGSNLGPITEYYTSINDANMKVFEAYNLSSSPTSPPFAAELEVHIDPTYVHHRHSLPMLLTNMPQIASRALAQMPDHIRAHDLLARAYNTVDGSWDEDHDDVYHTETYTETESYTDSKGNTQTRIVTKTRRVYDYTIHTYTFYPNRAYAAMQIIEQMYAEVPHLSVPEELVSARQCHAEGEFAVEKSHWGSDNKPKYDTITNILLGFHKRTTYFANIYTIEQAYEQTRLFAMRVYKNSLSSSRSVRYTTFSSSDSGPEEFRNYKQMRSGISFNYNLIGEIVQPIRMARDYSIKYYEVIQKYISIVMDRKKDRKVSESSLKDEILGTAKNWQQANFKYGISLHNESHAGWVVLKILGFLALFAIINGFMWFKEI